MTRPDSLSANPWRIAAGLVFLLSWAAVHVLLFYVIAGSGIVSEIFLLILRSFLLPGTASTETGPSFAWIPALQASLMLTGLAGIPAGLAFFLRKRRILLLWSAAIFVLGVVVAIGAAVILLAGGPGWFFGDA